MILVDLVSSINSALAQLAESTARRSIGDEPFGPNIGHAFFKPSRSGSLERVEVEGSAMWSQLRGRSIGILGAGAIAEAVAHAARVACPPEAVCHYQPPADPAGADPGGRREAFQTVLHVEALCVVLPWSEPLWTQVQSSRVAPVNAGIVLVIWRRSPAIERALVYLRDHYVEPIELGFLARIACMSKFHLVRTFGATLGITPHRYQLLLRLAQAKAMLREGTSITSIAHGVGFSDHSHLDRSFRVLTGMTPTEYQRSVAAG